MRLYSYCVRYDHGAAPNPYYNVCTLAICKPGIRKVAQTGDWIMGTGSKDVHGKSYEGKLVYAMKVTQVLSMKDYDAFCRENLPNKIPDIRHRDYRRRMGDSIYDFTSSNIGEIRPSVHTYKDRNRDFSGKNVLLSNHFYYFGKEAIPLPSHLLPLVKQGPGFKSAANDPLREEFILWVESLGLPLNKRIGDSQFRMRFKFEGNGDYSCEAECSE